jgi:hypothetical protein
MSRLLGGSDHDCHARFAWQPTRRLGSIGPATSLSELEPNLVDPEALDPLQGRVQRFEIDSTDVAHCL